MKIRNLFYRAILASFLIGFTLTQVKAAAVEVILKSTDTVSLLDVGGTSSTQTVGFYLEPKLSAKPGNDVTLKAKLDGKMTNLSITKGASLVFTPTNYDQFRSEGIFVKVDGKLAAGQASAVTLYGSGIVTKTIPITVTKAGGGTGTGSSAIPTAIDPSTLPGTSLTLETLFSKLLNVFIWIVTVAAFAGIVYSGFMYITAGGDTSKAELARKNLTWSIIGIIIALCSYVIINYVANWANTPTTSTNSSTTNTTSGTTGGSGTSETTSGETTSGSATTNAGPIDDIAP